jgi:hypothetical protein
VVIQGPGDILAPHFYSAAAVEEADARAAPGLEGLLAVTMDFRPVAAEEAPLPGG